MTLQNREHLSLLPTFKAIFDHRSLVDAGRALGLTQSAVSKQLAKLRDWLQDDLFVRTTHGMQPTQRALSLVEPVNSILQEVDALLADRPFDPSSLTGNVIIATTDEIRTQLLPELFHRVRTVAPALRLSLIPLSPDYSLRALEVGDVNLVISVNWHAPDQLRQRRLFSDRFVCLMSQNHPLAHKALTLENYAAAAHIMVAPLGSKQGFIDQVLTEHGMHRFVCLSVPDFGHIEPQILGDHHIVCLPHRIALQHARAHNLVIKPLPFDAPGFDYYVFWHQRFAKDPKTLWLRNLVLELLQDPQ